MMNELVARYPMGPHMRSWLGIVDADYRGEANDHPTDEETSAFQDSLLAKLEDSEIKSSNQLVDLLEELVGMNLPLLAIKLVDAYLMQFPQDDFRAQLHLGNACMMTGEIVRAEECFRVAQKLVPEEPAPYVNLTQIYCQDRVFADAEAWCKAGLDVDRNNLRLWELLAWMWQQQDLATTKDRLSEEAKRRHSWAGASLAVDLAQNSDDEPDVKAKLSALEVFYNEGLRDHDFLVEYTAVLGMAGQYERIPAIIWQIEKQATSGLPWQLHMHALQAFMGLGRDDQAREALEKITKLDGVPPQARSLLDALRQELGS